MDTALAPYHSQNETALLANALREQQEAQQQNVSQNELTRKKQAWAQQDAEDEAEYRKGMLRVEEQKAATEQKRMEFALQPQAPQVDYKPRELDLKLLEQINVAMKNPNASAAERLSLAAQQQQLMNKIMGQGGVNPAYAQVGAEMNGR
jgi:hypothetical protein